MQPGKSNVCGVLLALGGTAVLAVGTAAWGAATGSTAADAKKWKIALTSNREGDPEIYSMNADGSGARRLTRTRGFDAAYRWSPDGRKLVFGSTNGKRLPKDDLFVMNADGRGRRNLTRNPAFDCCASWSPDGRKIAFTTDRDGNNETYVVNVDGSGQGSSRRGPRRRTWCPLGRRTVGGSRS